MDTSTLPSTTDAYNALQSFNSTRPAATDYITKANAQYNIPQDQQQVSGLQGAVNNLTSSLQAVAPSVQGRTSGTFTTAGQQSALINKEQAPISTNLTNTTNALGGAQSVQSHDQTLANQMVQALLGQDSTKYQGLLDTYNAAQSASQQAEARKQFDATQALEQQKLAETQREFNLTPHGTAADSTGALLAALMAPKTAATPAAPVTTGTNPIEQAAYNDVAGRKGQSDKQLLSDFNATAVSANKGNQQDRLKVQFYQQLFPSLFKNPTLPASWLDNGSKLSF